MHRGLETETLALNIARLVASILISANADGIRTPCDPVQAGRRARRYYHVTPRGLAVAREAVEEARTFLGTPAWQRS